MCEDFNEFDDFEDIKGANREVALIFFIVISCCVVAAFIIKGFNYFFHLN